MSHLDNQLSQYAAQMVSLKAKIESLESEKKKYETNENIKKKNPDSNLESMQNWLILMEPLKDYYNMVEKCNQYKINAMQDLSPSISVTREQLAAFSKISNWQKKYPDILQLEREISFIRQQLPSYMFDNQSVGFASPVGRRSPAEGGDIITIPSKFMIDFIDGTHNICHLFTDYMKTTSTELTKLKQELSEIKKI